MRSASDPSWTTSSLRPRRFAATSASDRRLTLTANRESYVVYVSLRSLPLTTLIPAGTNIPIVVDASAERTLQGRRNLNCQRFTRSWTARILSTALNILSSSVRSSTCAASPGTLQFESTPSGPRRRAVLRAARHFPDKRQIDRRQSALYREQLTAGTRCHDSPTPVRRIFGAESLRSRTH